MVEWKPPRNIESDRSGLTYVIYFTRGSIDTDPETWQRLVVGNFHHAELSGLEPNSHYGIQIQLHTPQGNSPFSSIRYSTTLNKGWSPFEVLLCAFVQELFSQTIFIHVYFLCGFEMIEQTDINFSLCVVTSYSFKPHHFYIIGCVRLASLGRPRCVNFFFSRTYVENYLHTFVLGGKNRHTPGSTQGS